MVTVFSGCEVFRFEMPDRLRAVGGPPYEDERRGYFKRLGLLDVYINRVGTAVRALKCGRALMLCEVPAKRTVGNHFLVNASLRTLTVMNTTFAGRSASRRMR